MTIDEVKQVFDEWVKTGMGLYHVPLHGLLEGCLANDLPDAIAAAADGASDMPPLPDIVNLLSDLPTACRGSWETLEHWAAVHKVVRLALEGKTRSMDGLGEALRARHWLGVKGGLDDDYRRSETLAR